MLKQLSVGSSPGSVLWLVGWLVNMHSDHILRNLRKPGETGYKIPTGKGFSHETLGGLLLSPWRTNPITVHLTFTEENLSSIQLEILKYFHLTNQRALFSRLFLILNAGH